jgi:hypothetical protein
MVDVEPFFVPETTGEMTGDVGVALGESLRF